MVRNSRGTLSGNTRRLKGKMGLTVSKQVRTFEIGAKVIISQRAVSKGQPHMRCNGMHGRIVGKQGNSYIVEINVGGRKKHPIVSPIHLKEAKASLKGREQGSRDLKTTA